MTTDVAPVKFSGVVGMALRRWYIVFAGLLLTFPLSVLAAQHVAPKYTMKASVVLLVPQKSVGLGGNPYLALGGLDGAVDVIATGLSADAIQEKLVRTGATTGVVARDASTSAPILLITVEAPTKAAATAGVATLVDEVAPTLATIQRSAGVDQSQLIRSQLVAASKRAVVSHKPQIRAGLMVLFAGTAMTLLLAALLDSLLVRRRRRRSAVARDGVRPQLQVSGRIEDPETENEDQPAVSTLGLMSARGRKR